MSLSAKSFYRTKAARRNLEIDRNERYYLQQAGGECEYIALPTLKELFLDVWDNPNPSKEEESTICVRASDNPSLAFNGGDYNYYSHSCDRWCWDSNSSDFGSGDDDWVAGYFCGVPLILVGYYPYWGRDSDYEIIWENNSRTLIANSEARKLQERMLVVARSGGRICWRE